LIIVFVITSLGVVTFIHHHGFHAPPFPPYGYVSMAPTPVAEPSCRQGNNRDGTREVVFVALQRSANLALPEAVDGLTWPWSGLKLAESTCRLGTSCLPCSILSHFMCCIGPEEASCPLLGRSGSSSESGTCSSFSEEFEYQKYDSCRVTYKRRFELIFDFGT
ncbi:hypothetical protein CRG98_048124, partial [Punica granatum]